MLQYRWVAVVMGTPWWTFGINFWKGKLGWTFGMGSYRTPKNALEGGVWNKSGRRYMTIMPPPMNENNTNSDLLHTRQRQERFGGTAVKWTSFRSLSQTLINLIITSKQSHTNHTLPFVLNFISLPNVCFLPTFES